MARKTHRTLGTGRNDLDRRCTENGRCRTVRDTVRILEKPSDLPCKRKTERIYVQPDEVSQVTQWFFFCFVWKGESPKDCWPYFSLRAVFLLTAPFTASAGADISYMDYTVFLSTRQVLQIYAADFPVCHELLPYDSCVLPAPVAYPTSRGPWTQPLTRGLVGARQPRGAWTAFTDTVVPDGGPPMVKPNLLSLMTWSLYNITFCRKNPPHWSVSVHIVTERSLEKSLPVIY